MKRDWKAYLAAALMGCICGGYALATSLKVWSTGEVLRSSDLNANFSALNLDKVGGGKLLVDADVSASASIAGSKTAFYRYLPRAWTRCTLCTAGTCVCDVTHGVTSVTYGGATGTYVVVLSSTLTDVSYAVMATGNGVAGGAGCSATTVTTTGFHVDCTDASGAVNAGPSILVFDDN